MKKFAIIAASLFIGLSAAAQGEAKDCCKAGASKDCCKKEKTESCCKAGKSCGTKSMNATEAWATLYPQIEKSIQAPTFRQ